MLVGNRVPANIQKSLDDHGIAWKEVTFSHLKEFLKDKKDEPLLNLLDYEEPVLIKKMQKRAKEHRAIQKSQDSFFTSYLKKPRYKNQTFKEPTPLLITSNVLSDSFEKNLAILIEGSYQLLLEDRLIGSWGRTIGKYFELTQDRNKWVDENISNYLLAGSLTNTYHALNGLCEYYKLSHRFFNPDIAIEIVHYLKMWRLDYGAFASPVTNFDASWGNPDILNSQNSNLFRKAIPQLMRHTSNGFLVIQRLLELKKISQMSTEIDNKSIRKWEELTEIFNSYSISALKVLSAYSGLLEMEDSSVYGKVKYTPVYLILSVEEGLKKYGNDISKNENKNLQVLRSSLIEFVFKSALEPGEQFFCQF